MNPTTSETGPSGSAPPPQAEKPRRPRWRRWVVLALVLASLFVCRGPILRGVGRALVVDEPAQAADYLLLLDGDRGPERAADLLQAGFAPRLLLVEHKPGRLERLGIVAAPDARVRRVLAARGVPGDVLTMIGGAARDDWARARCLRDWLDQHPQASVVALCDRFGSRRKHHIFHQVLGREAAGRLRLRALPHRAYDEANWWLRKAGLLDVVNGYFRLTHVWLCGSGDEEGREWDPETYEKTL